MPQTIAVLPFLDLTSQSMDQEYFADGMTEELIRRLSQIPNVRVSSASASFYYKSKDLPAAQIGDALGVRYLLDGSVRQSGTTARLLQAEDGFVIWTRTYEGDVRAPPEGPGQHRQDRQPEHAEVPSPLSTVGLMKKHLR